MSKYLLAFFLVILSAPADADRPTYEISIIVDNDVYVKFGDSFTGALVDRIVSDATTDLKQLGVDLVVTYMEPHGTVAADEQPLFLLSALALYRQSNTAHAATDATILLTVRNLHIGEQRFAGYANTGSMCGPSAVGLVSIKYPVPGDGEVLAHELAHTLGVPHDGDSSGQCALENPVAYIMSAAGVGSRVFSPCSISVAAQILANACLAPTPAPPVLINTDPPKFGGGSMDLLLLGSLSVLLVVCVRCRAISLRRSRPIG